jgi:lysozyme family protein
MSFDKSIEFVFRWEGGYSNDPADAGGETKYGISKKAYPNLNIANLTEVQAKVIYEKDYWKASYCNLLPYPLSLAVFDYAVNAGPSRAVKALQGAVGASPDGVWGPQTLAKINEAVKKVGTKRLAVHLCNERANFYVDLVTKKPSQIKFLKGWMRRVFDLIMEIYNG